MLLVICCFLTCGLAVAGRTIPVATEQRQRAATSPVSPVDASRLASGAFFDHHTALVDVQQRTLHATITTVARLGLGHHGGGGEHASFAAQQTSFLPPAACVKIILYVSSKSRSGAVTPPKVAEMCSLWADATDCLYALGNSSQYQEIIPPGLVPILDTLHAAVCRTQSDGRLCSDVIDAMINATACAQYRGSSCPPECISSTAPATGGRVGPGGRLPPPPPGRLPPSGMSTSTACEPAVTGELVDNLCHSCITYFIGTMFKALADLEALQQVTGGGSLAPLQGLSNGVVESQLQLLRSAVCATTPTGERCLVSLGVATRNSSSSVVTTAARDLALTAAQGINGEDPLGTVPSSFVNTVCSSPNNEQCFARFVTSITALQLMEATDEFRECAATSAAAGGLCQTRLDGNVAAIDAWSYKVATPCARSDTLLVNGSGLYCLAVPDWSNKNVADWRNVTTGGTALFTASSPQSQSFTSSDIALINGTLQRWGCCARFVLAGAVDAGLLNLTWAHATAVNAQIWPLIAALPPACPGLAPSPSNPIVTRRLGLAVPWTHFAANASLYRTTLTQLTFDIAAAIGTSPDNFVNTTLTPNSSTALGRMQDAYSLHHAQPLSQGAPVVTTTFNFGILTSSAALTTQVAATFDRNVALGTLYLPSTNVALQQDGLISGGTSATPTAAPSPLPTTSGNAPPGSPTPPPTSSIASPAALSTGAVIGIVVGAICGLALVILIVVAAVRLSHASKPPRSTLTSDLGAGFIDSNNNATHELGDPRHLRRGDAASINDHQEGSS